FLEPSFTSLSFQTHFRQPYFFPAPFIYVSWISVRVLKPSRLERCSSRFLHFKQDVEFSRKEHGKGGDLGSVLVERKRKFRRPGATSILTVRGGYHGGDVFTAQGWASLNRVRIMFFFFLILVIWGLGFRRGF
ncbi:hypothetical protein VIGAN_01368400, partial [Vigna angularis var. angularis]